MIVGELMTHDPFTVGADATAKSALRLLHENVVTTLPVVDADGLLVGVVSDIDLVRRLVSPDPRARAIRPAEPLPLPLHVRDVMTTPAVSVQAGADVAAVVEVMVGQGLRSLPVLDHRDLLVGVVTRRDLVRLLSVSDATIAAGARSLVADLDLGGADLEVVDGTVHLSWPAESGPGVRRAVRAVVRSVPGVTGVVDEDHGSEPAVP